MCKVQFGQVELGYDEMYQALYSVDQPISFAEMVVDASGYVDAAECPQEELYATANDLAAVFNGDVEELIADSTTLYIYLVNYKGEGEGWFEYDSVKDRIAGKYVSKYNYAQSN